MAFQGLSRGLSAKNRAIANAELSTLLFWGWVLLSAEVVREPLEPFVAAVDRVRLCEDGA